MAVVPSTSRGGTSSVTSADVNSGAATAGQVLQANGAGGAAWATPFAPTLAVNDYLSAPFVTTGNVALGASGRLYYTRAFAPAAYTYDRISFYLSIVAGTTGTARLGVYTDVAGRPGALVLDAGTVAITAGVALKEITINQALAQGAYWLALQGEYTGTAPEFNGATNHIPFNPDSSPPLSINGYFQNNVGALPANAAGLTIAGQVPLVLMRRSA